ncbi:MAG: hypothetical protein Q9186_001851 [Xanthomendoza sp. 1 TL-2023]
MALRRHRAVDTVFPLETSIPQHFQYSIPIVYLHANTEEELNTGLQTIKDQLARLANGDWHDEGWVRAQTGDVGWMIKCGNLQPTGSAAPQQVLVVPTQEERHEEMVQARSQRAEALDQKRKEHEEREAAKPKPTRQRKPRPEGYTDPRVLRRQRAKERAEKKREYRANHPNPNPNPRPRKHIGEKSLPEGHDLQQMITRNRSRQNRESNAMMSQPEDAHDNDADSFETAQEESQQDLE